MICAGIEKGALYTYYSPLISYLLSHNIYPFYLPERYDWAKFKT